VNHFYQLSLPSGFSSSWSPKIGISKRFAKHMVYGVFFWWLGCASHSFKLGNDHIFTKLYSTLFYYILTHPLDIPAEIHDLYILILPLLYYTSYIHIEWIYTQEIDDFSSDGATPRQEMPGPGTYKTFDGEAIDKSAAPSAGSVAWRGVLTKIRPFEYFEWLGKQQESVQKTGIEPFYDPKSIFYLLW